MRGRLRRRVGEAVRSAGDPVKRLLLSIVMLIGARAAADPMYVPPAPRLEAPTDPVRLPPMVIPHEPEKEPIDKRPFLLAGGALVLAAVFIWNRDRARKLEAEHGPTPPRRRGRARDRNEDSEALADAAEQTEQEDKKDE